MISHQHQCIFIHIPKCAGSSVESAFGVRPKPDEWLTPNYNTLMGWSEEHQLHLQHASPQQLLDHQLITKKVWETYYKFIIIRNPYARALSDYQYLTEMEGIRDHFENYIKAKGKFASIFTNQTNSTFRGHHINPQHTYFSLNNETINYHAVVRLEAFQKGLQQVCKDLNLPPHFFNKKVNQSKKRFRHYSLFYNLHRKQLVQHKYAQDLKRFQYQFEDRKNWFDRMVASFPGYFLVNS